MRGPQCAIECRRSVPRGERGVVWRKKLIRDKGDDDELAYLPRAVSFFHALLPFRLPLTALDISDDRVGLCSEAISAEVHLLPA